MGCPKAGGLDLVSELLADRLCLALAERVDSEVLTADTAWGSAGKVKQIR